MIQTRPSRFPAASIVGALLFVLLGVPATAASQEHPVDRGVTGTALMLRQLDGVKRVLLIAAHPDDEDTALLTTLSRGQGAETAYLSLTRGDGGQNLIGPELFEGLGVIRTGELLAAREIDGGRQFFTRAFDYGYSKSADEALSAWPREELLRDVVWVVRTFRPQVIVSVFSGTERDGHGQHQAAGIMAREAFHAAADPARFPELLEPWQASKLYQRSRGQGFGVEAEVQTGIYDPVLGRSHFQVAMESRSQHRSQDMGQGQPLGPRTSNLVLVETAPGIDAEAQSEFWAGVDTTFVAVASSVPVEVRPEVERHLAVYRAGIVAARSAFSGLGTRGVAEALAEARTHLVAARGVAGEGDSFADVVATRLAKLDEAILTASEVLIEAEASDDLLVPGEEVEVTVELWNAGGSAVSRATPRLRVPDGWTVSGPVTEAEEEGGSGFFGGSGATVSGNGAIPPGALARWEFVVTVPADAEPSRLYFREAERDGAMYRWPDDRSLWGLPKDPPPVTAGITLSLQDGASDLTVEREVEYVGVDQAFGEFTEPLLVVPAVSVSVTPGTVVWPAAAADARETTVEVVAQAEAAGEVTLDVPVGWTVEPASQPFDLGAGESRAFTFRVTPSGAGAGAHVFRAVARLDDGRSYDEGYALLDYPHIERTAMFDPATVDVTVVPVRVAEGLRVGYVMGPGDSGPDALRQMGVDVTLLTADQVRSGDFSAYDALVIGIRAYETRPDLQAANQQVLDFAHAGGTVVVQYQQFAYFGGDYAPYAAELGGRPRVTDEHSPVELLAPESPLFTTPNRITDADFDGWVQERGLYFMEEWGQEWVPQIAFTDPGEEPLHGSLLVAPVGEGLYVYAAISFFRQFPAGVGGAYRLFANLVSLDRASWDAWGGGS